MNEREILRRTSRSFYLTLRLLPRAVRADASLGYLLARATDTVADTSNAEISQRLDLLKTAQASLASPELLGYLAEPWVKAQDDSAEGRLLAGLPLLWRRMQERPPAARARLRLVMGHILQGQIFDLERFGPGRPPLSEEELERYTYLVAGSVGEFWTDLCSTNLMRFSRDPVGLMRQRGRYFGQGLQLVNLLRDWRMDEALGRVYIAPEQITRWTEQASHWLGEGAAYCAALRSGRLRYATFLPALLGWHTLALAASQPSGSITPAKVPRRQVRACLGQAIPVWWSVGAVERLALKAGQEGSSYRGEREP